MSALSPTSREKLLQLDRAWEGGVRVMVGVRARARGLGKDEESSPRK